MVKYHKVLGKASLLRNMSDQGLCQQHLPAYACFGLL